MKLLILNYNFKLQNECVFNYRETSLTKQVCRIKPLTKSSRRHGFSTLSSKSNDCMVIPFNCCFCVISKRQITVLNLPIRIKSIQRNMFRVTGVTTRLTTIRQPVYLPKRHYPDQGYTGWKTTSKIIGKDPKTGHNIYEGQIVTATGQELPQHENSHVIVRDNATGRDVGILTSAKNLQKGNINIAPENYKGELLPNGQQKPQQFRAYDQPRFSKNTQNMVKDVQATTFVQKYDKELNDAVKKANTHNKPAIVRVDKNFSELYHPDGRAIFDSNGKEIDYVN